MQSKPWRKLWYLLGGSFFFALALFTLIEALLITLGTITAIFVAWEIVRFTSIGVNRWIVSHLGVILKREEGFRPTGGIYLLLAFLLLNKYVAIVSLFFLAIGDCMAKIIGEKSGKRRVFNRSLGGGILACLAACLLIGVEMTLVGPGMVLPVITAGTVSATMAGLLAIPVDDNLTVPLFSGGVMALGVLYFR